MNLRTVEKISMLGAVLVLICLAGIYGAFGSGLVMPCLWIGAILLAALLIVNLIYNRCPKCGAFLLKRGDTCTACGENLQKFR